jgi:ribosomal protein L27
MVKRKGADMKRILFFIAIVILLACLSIGWAQTVHYTNQITIAWDAVTKLADGTTIPAGDVIAYQVYTKKGTGAEVMVGEANSLQQTITFTVEGEYLIGVRTKRTITGGVVTYSDITWSNSADVVAVPSPFSVGYYLPPDAPKGFKTIP